MRLVDWVRALQQAIVDGEHVRALETAVAAWRACRHSAIADLVDALSARVSSNPLPARLIARDFQVAWLRVADEHRDADTGLLLASLTRRIPPEQPSPFGTVAAAGSATLGDVYLRSTPAVAA